MHAFLNLSVLVMCWMYEPGLHLQVSQRSRRHYSGGSHAEFVDDLMLTVAEKYGALSDPSTWILKDIVRCLEAKVDFWTRWNHVDHLCSTHVDLYNFCNNYKHSMKKK